LVQAAPRGRQQTAPLLAQVVPQRVGAVSWQHSAAVEQVARTALQIGAWQCPWRQTSSCLSQEWPQPPQWSGSVWLSTQVPPQHFFPEEQGLSSSQLSVETQVPAVAVVPLGQAQRPSRQT
jgi:hypothetical protein